MTHAKHTGINKSQVVIADNQWTAEAKGERNISPISLGGISSRYILSP